MKSKVTIPSILNAKKDKRKISMLTAYDYLMAKILDEAEIDILLVGDSVGFVHMGLQSTIPVTMDQMVYHSSIVARATERALVITDMPFGSYTVSKEEAVKNAIRLVKDGGAHGVKLEGGKRVLDKIKAIIEAEIPVMGHLGLTPQSEHKFGGFKVQAKSEDAVERLISDALALEEVGVFSIVLEGIPIEAARRVTEILRIPTIGIGAGKYCDGQVLVTHDMLGLTDFTAKFVKEYSKLKSEIISAAKLFSEEVKNNQFPTLEYSYDVDIKKETKADLIENISDEKKSFDKI
ncbi:MAG: 3-methyl-2-oxobutanoate hydroxymethyltransferase [Asgard group archaeon]|jgi:3-methyl-2-oxobutanoate hydroxymethyltransferase|nr:3-methyl-2-oxobutanoate hydroxymethyltransferase [Asgard group archaeon]|tara:strand:+ start:2412 stop:3287 length:876 start_codon:yes stop_codon:yes gene_type:complete